MEKKYLMPIIAIAIILIIGLIVLTPQTQNQNVIRVGHTPLVHGLPFYLALEKGYFEEAGITIERVKFDSPTQIVDALMQGKIDITPPVIAAGIVATADYQNPDKIKVYALSGGNFAQPSARIIVAKDSEIENIQDLKGKKLGILGSSIQWRVISQNLLEDNGLQVGNDVTIVELAPGLQVQTLASGQIDALLALDPMGTVAIETGVGKVIMNNPCEETIAEDSWIGVGAVNVSFAKENPELTEKFIAIMDKAIAEIENNPLESAQYVEGYTPVSKEFAAKIVFPIFKTCSRIEQKDFENFQIFMDLFTEYNAVDGHINIANFMYCS